MPSSLVRVLSRRMVGVMVVAMAVTAVLYAVFKPVELEYELGAIAEEIGERVRRNEAGQLDVRIDPEFTAWLAAIEALHLRVYEEETGRTLFAFDQERGDPRAVEALIRWPPGFFVLGHHEAEEHDYGFIELLETEDGDVIRVVARRGPANWHDLYYWITTEFTRELGPIISAVFLFGAALAVWTVRRALAPLGRIARQARAVRPGESARLDTAGIPEEILPLVEAVNRMLDRLQDAFAQQRRFTAFAAHELRTPLAALRARLDGLPPDLPERDALLRSVERMAHLVDQLLAVARLESGEIRPDEIADLREIAREVVIEYAPLALTAGKEIALSEPEEPVPALVHRDSLLRAIANLVHNALKYAPEGTLVEVIVERERRVLVQDRGPGLGGCPPEELFEAFRRARHQRADVTGAGLGLAVVRETAQLHGGRAFARERPGGGAVFGIELPAP